MSNTDPWAIDNLKHLLSVVYHYNSVGGTGHIVFDDFNVEDQHIEWCLNYCKEKNKDYDPVSVKATEAALHLLKKEWDVDQREDAVRAAMDKL